MKCVIRGNSDIFSRWLSSTHVSYLLFRWLIARNIFFPFPLIKCNNFIFFSTFFQRKCVTVQSLLSTIEHPHSIYTLTLIFLITVTHIFTSQWTQKNSFHYYEGKHLIRTTVFFKTFRATKKFVVWQER
jgi:hypothetical protein